MVGIICPLVVIGLAELPNSGWAKAHPAHPLAASLEFHSEIMWVKFFTISTKRGEVRMNNRAPLLVPTPWKYMGGYNVCPE